MDEHSTSNLALLLLDNLSSPVIIFNVTGEISYANSAAKKINPNPTLLLNKSPQIQKIVKDVLMGQLVLPASLDITLDIDNAKIISGKFVRGLSRYDVAFLPETPEQPDSKTVNDHNFDLNGTIKLIQHDLLPSATELIQKLKLLEAESSQIENELSSDLQASIKDLKDRLSRLVDLTDTFGTELNNLNDILVLPEILQSACNALKAISDKFYIELVIDLSNRELPQIYGNRRLIYRAIFEVLHHTMLNARASVVYKEWMQIKISLMTTGSFLSIAIHSMGAISKPASTLQKKVSITNGPLTSDQELQHGLQIGIPMAKRIIELHGGTVKISNDESRGLFVLFELPTGAPIQQTSELHMLQAKAYAADLSKLFERMRKSKK